MIFEAPPVPGIERSSSPILGAGVLDVPPEVWGHLHEPFREGRTASLFGLRNSAVSSEYTSLGKRRCYGYLIRVRNYTFYNY